MAASKLEWSLLNDDCKLQVLKKLDFASRMRMMQVDRNSNFLVKYLGRYTIDEMRVSYTKYDVGNMSVGSFESPDDIESDRWPPEQTAENISKLWESVFTHAYVEQLYLYFEDSDDVVYMMGDAGYFHRLVYKNIFIEEGEIDRDADGAEEITEEEFTGILNLLRAPIGEETSLELSLRERRDFNAILSDIDVVAAFHTITILGPTPRYNDQEHQEELLIWLVKEVGSTRFRGKNRKTVGELHVCGSCSPRLRHLFVDESGTSSVIAVHPNGSIEISPRNTDQIEKLILSYEMKPPFITFRVETQIKAQNP